MAKSKASKETLERWKDRVAWIMNQSFNATNSPAARVARVSRARKDYAFFVTTYFPHLADKPCAWFHIAAAQYIKANPRARALFEWARGHAKSSHISLMIPIWLSIQEPRDFNVMILVSKSEDMAVRLLGDLQAELQYNELLNSDFGEQPKAGNWAEGEFYTNSGCMFVALGRGQSPRGLKNRGKRPDYISYDDVDDDELVENPKRVGKAVAWLTSALLGTMAMGRGRFVGVGNRIGKISIIAQMALKPGYHHHVVNALDRNGNPSWKENYSLEEIEAMRTDMGERSFQKEMMNNPITEGTVFLDKNIRYVKPLELKHYRSLVVYTDPSFKDGPTADYKGTVVLGKTKDGYIHILKAYVEQASISRMIAWHYEIDQWVDGRVPVRYMMEASFMQDSLLNDFRSAGEGRGQHIAVVGDKRKKPDKFSRIEGMQPSFEKGLILLSEKEKDSPGMKKLVEQLLMFEKGSRVPDDGPDALEGGVFILNRHTASSSGTYRVGRVESRHY